VKRSLLTLIIAYALSIFAMEKEVLNTASIKNRRRKSLSDICLPQNNAQYEQYYEKKERLTKTLSLPFIVEDYIPSIAEDTQKNIKRQTIRKQLMLALKKLKP
jgi:hypothetical protein